MLYLCGVDGWVVLCLLICEFLCSEVMYYLGVLIMCVLLLVGIGEDVVCDMFYDGYLCVEFGVIVCWVLLLFLCFGLFELLVLCGEIVLL